VNWMQIEKMIFEFHIQIIGLRSPTVWRTVRLSGDCTFADFHVAIQYAFGWRNSHMFEFSESGWGSTERIGQVDDEYCEEDGPSDGRLSKISDIFKQEGQSYVYIYDFGDNWEHAITLKKIGQGELRYPECVAGGGQCPPENIGSIPGYASFKKILANPENEEREEYVEWLIDGGYSVAGEWDPTEFDLKDTREFLFEVFQGKEMGELDAWGRPTWML